MPIEQRPGNPLPKEFVPPDSTPYRVQDGDSWITVARTNGMDPWDLIFANFRTRNPAEVNWYLRNHVGCKLPTNDLRNWKFSASAQPGIIHVPRRVIRLPPVTITGKVTSKLDSFWVGVGKSHSGDLFVIGAHDMTAKVYNLGGATIAKVQNAVININGWKFGAGLGGSIGAVFVIAHGFDKPGEMNGVKGEWSFDLALGAGLASWLKGVKGLGRAVDTVEKYKKLRYLSENAIKNLGITEPGIYTIPIPGAEGGVHIWGGYQFGDVKVVTTGLGVP